MANSITASRTLTPQVIQKANRAAQGGSLQENSDQELGPGVQDELLRGQQERARRDREQVDAMRQLSLQLGRRR